MEDKKNNNVILIILLIIAVLIASCFGYMWYKNKNVTCPKCEDISNVESKISVVDAFNGIPSYFGEGSSNKIKFVIPKIIGGKENVEVLNKNILNDIISRVFIPIDDNCDLEENAKGCESGNVVNIDVSYKYLIKNDIVGILVTAVLEPWNASGTGEFYYNYFYDTKNDKILTVTEALEFIGYSEEKYLIDFTKCTDESGNEIKCTIEHIKKTINDNDCTYVDINNNEFKVHFDDSCN